MTEYRKTKNLDLENLKNEETMTHVGSQRHKKK